MRSRKANLNYEVTHRKIERALDELKKEGGKLTVASVSERSGVSLATAYNHGCPDMIREVLKE